MKESPDCAPSTGQPWATSQAQLDPVGRGGAGHTPKGKELRVVLGRHGLQS